MNLPRWFRAVLGVFFLAVVGTLLLVRNGGVREVLASTILDRVVRDYVPMMEQTIALPRRQPEPPDGAYYLNGMLVQYHTMPATVGPAETLRRLDVAFHQTGYRTRMLTVMNRPTLVAIHPQTKMLLTARPGRDRAGGYTVRLSQQDLSELNARFRAEIPGLPVVPGARNRILIRSAEGPPVTSMMFTVDDSPDGATSYYLNELRSLGWSRMIPPGQSPLDSMKTMFFEKGQDECYVVAGPGGRTGESFVMVMLSGKGRT